MTTNAAFKIRNVTSGGAWSAFSDRGFDCDHGDELEVQLENQPALDVRTGVFSSVGSSKDAPDLTYSSSGVLATAASTITITVPAASPGMTADSWIVRSQTNGGEAVLVNGRNDWTVNTAERMICVRSGGLRKIIATERDQYSESGGWADAQNEVIEVVASSLASLTTSTSGLESQISAAASGIASLETRLSTEESARASADTSLETRLSGEESTRASVDSSIDDVVTSHESRISTLEAGGSSTTLFDPASIAATGSGNITRTVGFTFTWSTQFACIDARTCVGARFFAKSAVTETATFTIWSVTGTPLAQKATAAGAVNGTGYFSVTWDSPVTIDAETIYFVGVYISNTYYIYGGNTTTNIWTSTVTGGPLFTGKEAYDPMWYATSANTFPTARNISAPGSKCTVAPVFG